MAAYPTEDDALLASVLRKLVGPGSHTWVDSWDRADGTFGLQIDGRAVITAAEFAALCEVLD